MSAPQHVILRLQGSTQTTTSTFVTTSTTTKTSIIKNDLHLDKERRNAKISKALESLEFQSLPTDINIKFDFYSIQQQLTVDQNAALKPDTKRPFSSRDDACKRLLRYHVFNSPVMTREDMDKSIGFFNFFLNEY